jgi:hypothetical protein
MLTEQQTSLRTYEIERPSGDQLMLEITVLLPVRPDHAGHPVKPVNHQLMKSMRGAVAGPQLRRITRISPTVERNRRGRRTLVIARTVSPVT